MSALTKQALAHALKNILLEKPLNRVTVNDIVKECGVNRQTFYYHFRDVPDLVSWTIAQDARVAFSDFKDKNGSWEEGFMALFGLILQDKKFILNIYHSVSLEILQEYVYRLLYPSLLQAVNASSESASYSEEEKRFAADFYKYALAGIILNWIKGDMREDPQKIVRRLMKLMNSGIKPIMAMEFSNYEKL